MCQILSLCYGQGQGEQRGRVSRQQSAGTGPRAEACILSSGPLLVLGGPREMCVVKKETALPTQTVATFSLLLIIVS